MSRYVMIPLALVGMLVGLAFPLAGCGCPVDDLEGSYVILDDEDAAASSRDWVEGSGRVEVDQETIVISYATPDGSQWEVEFERTQTHLPE